MYVLWKCQQVMRNICNSTTASKEFAKITADSTMPIDYTGQASYKIWIRCKGWVSNEHDYMSKSRKMLCLSCGYETEVYDGRGLFQQEIIPMECLDCHTVQNIVVGGIIGEVAPSFNSEAGRLCPKCSSMNIRRWNRHTCPKCGGEMVAEGKDEFWTWSIADIIHY